MKHFIHILKQSRNQELQEGGVHISETMGLWVALVLNHVQGKPW